MLSRFLSTLFFRKIPAGLSVVFHPLLMPAYGTLLLLYNDTSCSFADPFQKKIYLTIVLSCTLLLPVALLPFVYLKQLSKRSFTDNKRDRIIPLLFTTLLYFTGFYLLGRTEAPFLLRLFIFSAFMNVLITLVVTLFWKISAHMIGTGGLTAFIFLIMWIDHAGILLFLMTAILISGLTGYARLSLDAHTPAQVFWGWLTGFFTVFLATFFFLF